MAASRQEPPAPVVAALRDCSEQLRRADEATRRDPVAVIDVDALLGTVTTLVDRLAPVVLHAQRCALAHGAVRPGTDRDPAEHLQEVVTLLGAAHAALVAAARALGRGQSALSRPNHRPTDG